MAKILWLNWSGGGNLPPSLGIARVLTKRGHDVALVGRPEMVPRVARAGLRAIELSRAYEQVGRYPTNKYIPKVASYLTSPAVGEQIRAVVAAETPDLVIVDAMFPVALAEAARLACPTVVMCHTAVFRALERWRQMMAMLVGLREEAGFGALPADLDASWMTHDRLLVTTLAALDEAPGDLAHRDRLRYVGPCLESEPHAERVALPWPDDGVPLVLVSFSTAPEQGSVAKFQSAIDALAALAVRGVVTVGDSVDPGLLRTAANVVVVATANHDDLMRRAAMVITHGGHGTLMRALRSGLPILAIPGMAHDQAVNAAAVQDWGVGISVAGDATPAITRAAVERILGDAFYRETARSFASRLSGVDGAANAVLELETILDSSRGRRVLNQIA